MGYLTCDHRRVLNLVDAERDAQDAKWGEQNHPNGTGPNVRMRWSAHTLADAARVCKKLCQANGPDEDNWRDILLEEVFEALAEEDPVKLRAELVQVAAVACAWVEAIDRRGAS